MKTVLTIIKKEFARFFKDTRLWITALILPGLLIFALYSIMGTIMEDVEDKNKDYQPVVYVENLPESQTDFETFFNLKEDYNFSDAVSAVRDGGLDLYIRFPENFDEAVKNYTVGDGRAPNVQIYYNTSNTNSVTAYSTATALLSIYEDSIANKFDINRPEIGVDNGYYDLADADSVSKSVLSMVVPMVLLMLLFSGCMAVAPESIAGEKERGTIATLLVTPVKRSVVAVGKIAALSVIALLSGLSSALGMLLSLPKLAGSAGGGISFSMYGIGDYTVILSVILSTVLVLVAIISIVSAYAKSVKEANGLVVPIMILVMLCGVFSMFASGIASIGLYFIPVFNSALVISTVLSGTVLPFAPLVTACVNVAFAALLVFVLTRMFNSERIMFNR